MGWRQANPLAPLNLISDQALSKHFQAIGAKVVIHAPVLRYTFQNAVVGRAGFATWTKTNRYNRDLLSRPFFQNMPVVDHLRYCHSYVSWRYFGHWLTDSIPTSLLDQGAGQAWLPHSPSWHHAREYAKIFQLQSCSNTLVYAKQLFVYQDFSQGASKRERFDLLRKILHSKFGSEGNTDCIYLRRGSTGVSREIVNETQFTEDLIHRGWKVVDISSLSVAELHTQLCNAAVVVSIDGSHIDHAHLSMKQGSKMIVLQPGDRFSTRQVGLCRAHGVSIGMVILNRADCSGYFADAEEVIRTIDILFKN